MVPERGFIMNKTGLTGGLLHGGDYNPEQWLDHPEILAQDIKLMKAAKINEVTLGVFSWSVLEPEEGTYHFEWLTDIVDRLYENGISVIMATPSGARPKWLSDRYPEVLRVDAQRRRTLFGGRHNHCYTSPIYREKVRQIDRELAKRFGSHPGVIMWHISNEFGGECHCSLCQTEFRRWLKKKYGTIEHLNKCWCTTFWSHTYDSFDQIESPSPVGESHLHGLNLDWKRFVTDRTVDFAAWEKAAIRESGSEKPVTINMMYNYTGLNYHKFQDTIDIASWDNYPTWHKEPEEITARDTGFEHDYVRSVLKKPFLLMESCPSSTNWQSVSKLKKPGMLLAASLQAVAHGSDGVLYFQIRQSRGASEKFHGAVIDHTGRSDTRVLGEVTAVGDALWQLEEVAGTVVSADAAIIWDRESIWAMNDAQGPRNKGLHEREEMMACYGALRSMGIGVDIVDMEQPLSSYKIVIAPMLYMFRAGIEEKIRHFVEMGGVFIMTCWSGVVDEYDRCFLGDTPGNLCDVMGVRREEIDGLYDWEANRAVPVTEDQTDIVTLSGSYECRNLCELLKAEKAETLMVYEDDFYAGHPAVTYMNYKAGKAFYVASHMGQDFWKELLGKVEKYVDLKRPVREIPAGVEVTVRENGDFIYLFLQNFGRAEAVIEVGAEKAGPTYECIYGEFDGTLKPLQTVVLRGKKSTIL